MKWLWWLIAPAYAFTLEQPLPDPAMEARAQALFKELRCMVCQGQALADSEATLARDMRKLVREKLSEGMQDEVIKEYLVRRYGDQIVLSPPITHYALWFAPMLLLAAGGYVIWRQIK